PRPSGNAISPSPVRWPDVCPQHRLGSRKMTSQSTIRERRLTPSRRSWLLGTVAVVASANLAATSAWAQQLAGSSGPSSAGAAFLALSRRITGHANLDGVTASRIFAAMSRARPDFSARVNQLAELAKDSGDPKALLMAAEHTGLRETALAIVSAWYTGTV